MSSEIVLVGYGLVRVGEYWNKDVVSIGVEAAARALEMAGNPSVGGVYIGSALSSTLGIQGNVAVHVADELGLGDCVTETVSSGGASSGLAILNGIHQLMSGEADYVLVGGVEKISDSLPSDVMEAVLIDLDRRVMKYSGLTEAGLAAILTRLYIDKYGVDKEKVTALSVLDHENGVYNPYAMFRRAVSLEMAMSAPIVADPLTIFDVAPYGDGAAFVVLTTKDKAVEAGIDYVELFGYGVSRNRVPVNYRDDLLSFDATSRAASVALDMAGLDLSDIDSLQIFDSFSITGVLALEGLGVSPHGSGADDVSSGKFNKGNKPAVNLMGGLKARGNPIGATGLYQVSEAMMLIRDVGVKYVLVHMMSGFDDNVVVFVLGGGGHA